MRIAVVGSGISGLASAWLLSRKHEVHLFEAEQRLGGHTDTHEVEVDGEHHRVDTGFIVHNRDNYPLLCAMFDELGVDTTLTTMSFSVSSETSGVEYNATSLAGLFCRKRNALSPRFWRMLADIPRFYREAPGALATATPMHDVGESLGEYLIRNRYSDGFRDDHIVPMASALWSAPSDRVLEFPLRYLVEFMTNHRMLQVEGRPQWRVVAGGSSRYIEAMRANWKARTHLATPVRQVRRDSGGILLSTDHDESNFDRIVLACHSDQALTLLADASADERAVLGSIAFQPNEVILHTDARLLPHRRGALAAWNARVSGNPATPCTVSYSMNLLQGIRSRRPLVVTLNQTGQIAEKAILQRRHYAHPAYDHASVTARARKACIQGKRGTWFAGAYWGWGFHEDGMRSAVEVARAFGVDWPTVRPSDVAPMPRTHASSTRGIDA